MLLIALQYILEPLKAIIKLNYGLSLLFKVLS